MIEWAPGNQLDRRFCLACSHLYSASRGLFSPRVLVCQWDSLRFLAILADLRVAYMLNELEEAAIKKKIKMLDKQRQILRDITNIYKVVIDTGGNCLKQYVIDQDQVYEIIDIAI